MSLKTEAKSLTRWLVICRFVVIYTLFFGVSTATIATPFVEITPTSRGIVDITTQAQLFTDVTGTLGVEAVRKQTFLPLNAELWFLPFSDYATWAKWEFKNTSGKEQKYAIHLKNELIENTELYQYDSARQQFVLVSATNFLTPKQKKLASNEPLHFITLSATETTEVYIRVRSKRGLVINAVTFPAHATAEVLTANYGRMAFFNGALVFRLLLVLILGFFVIRVRTFRAYSFYILFKTVGYWGIINYIGPLFATNPVAAQKIDYFAYTSNTYFVVLLAVVLFPVLQKGAKLTLVLLTLLGLMAINQVLLLNDYAWEYVKAGAIIQTVVSGFVLFLYAFSIFKRHNVQHFYAIPFVLGIVGFMLMNVQVLTQIPIPFAGLLTFVLFIAEILIFIFFLGKIFRENEVSKLAALQESLNKEVQVRQLRELDELKSQFFTNISHELKTPLTLITGPFSELRKRYPHDKFLDLVLPNVKRLQELVHQLLDIQTIEEGKQTLRFERLDLANYLRTHVLAFESFAETKQITIHLDQSHAYFWCCVDVDKLSKIINNLLSNAIKYAPDNSHVWVEVIYTETPKSLELRVRDEGSGIAAKDLPHVFDRFYRVENATTQGSGVGLALVKELVGLWGGSVSVASEPTVGTVFTVSLPVDENTWKEYMMVGAEVAPSVVNESELVVNILEDNTAGEKNSERPLLLVVDDNPDMRTYLQLLLADEYEIITATNGLEGIEKADETVPDLIISDLMMPQMDGFAFSRKIKGQRTSSHVPIVMLTAKATKASKMEGLDIGIDHYLHKPFDADELRGIIRNCLANRRRLQQAVLQATNGNGMSNVSDAIDPLASQFMQQLTEVLTNHYTNPKLAIGELAERMHLSEKQLRRKLNAVAGVSPVAYLRKFRLQQAAILLRKPGAAVSEIAYAVGYENLSYFAKIFQEEYGRSPSEYAS